MLASLFLSGPEQQNAPRSEVQKKAWLAIAATCFILPWFFLVVTNTSYAPRSDDFDIVLDPLVNCAECESSEEKLINLFSVHNEHRPALIRLMSFAFDSAFGSVDFVLLAAIGNIFIILLFFVLYASCSPKPGLAVLPVLMILFNFQHFDTSTWASGAVCHYGFLFFSISAIYLSCSSEQSGVYFFCDFKRNSRVLPQWCCFSSCHRLRNSSLPETAFSCRLDDGPRGCVDRPESSGFTKNSSGTAFDCNCRCIHFLFLISGFFLFCKLCASIVATCWPTYNYTLVLYYDLEKVLQNEFKALFNVHFHDLVGSIGVYISRQ